MLEFESVEKNFKEWVPRESADIIGVYDYDGVQRIRYLKQTSEGRLKIMDQTMLR